MIATTPYTITLDQEQLLAKLRSTLSAMTELDAIIAPLAMQRDALGKTSDDTVLTLLTVHGYTEYQLSEFIRNNT